jgi:hypothetical protein
MSILTPSKKASVFAPGNPLLPSQLFARNARPYPIGAPFCALLYGSKLKILSYKNYRFVMNSKLMCLSKQVQVTDSSKNTSLLCILSIFRTL